MNGMEGRAKGHEFVRTYVRNKNTAYDDLECVEARQPSAIGTLHMCSMAKLFKKLGAQRGAPQSRWEGALTEHRVRHEFQLQRMAQCRRGRERRCP